MKLLAFDHAQLTVPTADEAAARRFYREVLGLDEAPKPPQLAARGGFWLRLGETALHIGLEDGVDRARTRAHLAFRVEALEGWRRRLAAAGVATLAVEPLPGLARCEFRDPFGNRLELVERLDARARPFPLQKLTS